MGSNPGYISDILFKYCSKRPLTDKEQFSLDQWLAASEQNREVLDKLMDSSSLQADLKKWLAIDREVDNAWIEFSEKMHDPGPGLFVRRIHFLKTAWFRYAAAILIVLAGTVAYLQINNQNNKGPASTTETNYSQTDIAPGGEKATLTLADGSKIVLDNAVNGNLVSQGSAQVVKLANGQIVYDLRGASGKEVVWNTMSTPKGGQYQVTLPDGTNVWLNASSSITFPTAFNSNKREVKIQGEIYFEVTKNKQKPFIVDIDGKSLVEVLGTSFNINSYDNENSIKTTLLEGSVRVFNTASGAAASERQDLFSGTDNDKKQSVTLQPGQQAQLSTFDIEVISNVNPDQTLAWKNGLFNFDGADLKTVMRQLERWYDIKVRYEGPVSNLILEGKMYRNANLSEVLEILNEMGVRFRMDGKTLIVN